MIIVILGSINSLEVIAQKDQNQIDSKLHYKRFFSISNNNYSTNIENNTQQLAYNKTENLSSVEDTFITYQSKTKPLFTIQYPSIWKTVEHNEGDGVMFQKSHSSNNNIFLFFNISVQKSMVPFSSLIGQLDYVIQKYNQTFQKFQPINVQPFNLTKNTAIMLEFTYMDDRFGETNGMDIVMISNGYLYILEYRAKLSEYENNIPIIFRMVDSFRIYHVNDQVNSQQIKKHLESDIRINRNPIPSGENQTLRFFVRDSNNSQPIPGATIFGLADSGTAYENKFILYTDSNGFAIYRWQIPDLYIPGPYNLLIWINSNSYETELYLKEFEIIAK